MASRASGPPGRSRSSSTASVAPTFSQADGSARFEAQYSFVYPNGKEAGSKVFMFWDGPPPPAKHLQIVENRVSIEIDADKPLGEYLARVKVCNVSNERCVVAVHPFRVLAGSGR